MEAITPQVIFTLFGLPIRSTVLATWISMVMIIAGVILINHYKPSMADSLVEFISNIIKDIMSRENIDKFMPLLGTLIIFITISNILGVFPLLSAPTSDINTTVALSLVIFFAIHFYGVAANGFFKYFKDMASPIFMLPLEIIGQISRTLSLSLRLFGNILSGELIASIVFSLVPLFLPLPLIGLSLLIGVLQAYVFTALASVYISSAVEISQT